jgi:hypothetical protein
LLKVALSTKNQIKSNQILYLHGAWDSPYYRSTRFRFVLVVSCVVFWFKTRIANWKRNKIIKKCVNAISYVCKQLCCVLIQNKDNKMKAKQIIEKCVNAISYVFKSKPVVKFVIPIYIYIPDQWWHNIECKTLNSFDDFNLQSWTLKCRFCLKTLHYIIQWESIQVQKRVWFMVFSVTFNNVSASQWT